LTIYKFKKIIDSSKLLSKISRLINYPGTEETNKTKISSR